MAVRNFYVRGHVDGRETPVGFGPPGKQGGFGLDLLIRSNGQIAKAYEVRGVALANGRLRIEVTHPNGKVIAALETER